MRPLGDRLSLNKRLIAVVGHEINGSPFSTRNSMQGSLDARVAFLFDRERCSFR